MFFHRYKPDSHFSQSYYYSIHLTRCSFKWVNLNEINVVVWTQVIFTPTQGEGEHTDIDSALLNVNFEIITLKLAPQFQSYSVNALPDLIFGYFQRIREDSLENLCLQHAAGTLGL